MTTNQLLEKFKDMLPASLGEPYCYSTNEHPPILVAFYEFKRHKNIAGKMLIGNEFRLWDTMNNNKKFCPLAGIIGMDKQGSTLMICALRHEGTTAKDLMQYEDLLRAMAADINKRFIEGTT